MDIEQNKADFRKTLVQAKKNSESYVVLSIYKDTELYFDSNLTVDDFGQEEWKFFFAIAEKAIKSGKKVLDDIVLGLIVSENSILEQKYNEYGGFNTITTGTSFVQIENFESYLTDIKKFNALIRLNDFGFPIMEKYEAYKLMTADAIQQALDGVISTVFSDIEVDEKVEDLSTGLLDAVMEAHEGANRGFPYSSSLLTEYTNGMALGTLSLVSAGSGVGKTFFIIDQILPMIIEFEEKILIMANEEEKKKWQYAIITWVINNILGGDFQKNRFNQGNFTADEMTNLKKAVDWLDDKMKQGNIQFVNFSSFNMKKSIKLVKKYKAVHDISYYILDTLKLDSDAINENSWLSLMQNVTDLHDVIKPSALNCSVVMTYQLGKSSINRFYLDQNALGMSKGVVDTCAVLIMLRKAFESELDGGKNEISVKTPKGQIVKMSKDKSYFIVFLGKNRAGATNRQIVYEIDQGRNICRQIGLCNIEQDY